MSGGRLVVLDALGRGGKHYPLPKGLVTLGSDRTLCDILLLVPSVSSHHATIQVHANQTVVHNMSEKQTLVNGQSVSVAALQHGDVITVGNRRLRWEYDDPTLERPLAAEPALCAVARGRKPRRRARSAHARLSGAARDARALRRLALQLSQRASMPASGKQVAIVQPQRRETSNINVASTSNQNERNTRRKVSKSEGDPSESTPNLENMTKATLWIESRKSSPRKSARESAPTPLRTALLKRSVPTKIQAPLKLDHTKQVAINLMTGHIPKSRLSTKPKTPLLVVKKHSPKKRTSLKRSSSAHNDARNSSVRVVEINETDPGQSFTTLGSNCTMLTSALSPPSLLQQTPRKSALKDPKFNKNIRKNESIKFDLSNLEKQDNEDTLSEKSDNLSLRLSVDSPSSSPSKGPSPRPPLRRSRQILEMSLGKTIDIPVYEGASSKSPTPQGRRSSRGNLMLQKCLDQSASTETSENASYNKTRTVSPRTSIHSDVFQDYSIVDMTPTETSHYSSLGSQESFSFASKKSSPRSKKSKSLSTPENSEEIQKQISLNSTKISRASKSRSRLNDIEAGKLSISCFSSDGDSPRTSRRSIKSSNQSSFVTADVSRDVESAGTVTPENEVEPEEASTPVLNIQNLLHYTGDSPTLQRSPKVRANLKRKTIGFLSAPRITRAGAKWKSLDGSSGRNTEEKASTPKTRAHLSPETVKDKHSTAKKSQSRRSIIDDLGKSDISKQLFNSPVKRKLSHSMTEFSKSQLSEEDDVSFSNTAAYTPDRFVSPLNSPTRSSNYSGVKRLFRKNSPENDLRDLRGVKTLLRTPRAKRGDDDLTNVSGVKLLFNKSPKNRLSDVRVKELFAGSAKNDLRRITGVKRILRTDSPVNDLRNVSGVKRMLRTDSPKNDLRNVSGVKRMLRNSPKNDLGDVRGVRLLFGREKRNSLNEMSGVEQLFNDSRESHKDVSNAEILFDQLLGKPPIKATYSKSFSNQLSQKSHQTRKAKSFHDPVDISPNNVEDWLENELKKTVHKACSAKKTASCRKSELENLVTDTVEGNSPLKSSRVRSSTILASSQSYAPHTLPIKKRSLIDSCSIPNSTSLPLKKRSIIHSTPLKKKTKVADVLDLSRVSPIEAAGSAHTSAHKDQTHQNESRQSKSRRSLVQITNVASTTPKETPITTAHILQLKIEQNKTAEIFDSKSRRSTFVVPKKAPVLLPTVPQQGTAKKTNLQVDGSPKRRPLRQAKQTRSNSVQSKLANTKVKDENNKRKTRKDDKKNDEAEIVEIKGTRATRKTAKDQMVSEANIDTETKTRQTRSGVVSAKTSKVTGKRVAEKVTKAAVIDKKVNVESGPSIEVGSRSKKTAAVKSKRALHVNSQTKAKEKGQDERNRRGRKTVTIESTDSGKMEVKQRNTREVKSSAKVDRGKESSRKRRGEATQPTPAPKRTKVAEVAPSPKPTRAGRTRAASSSAKQPQRVADAPNPSPPPVKSRRGTDKTIDASSVPKKRNRAVKTVAPSSSPKRTRGAVKAVDSSSSKSTKTVGQKSAPKRGKVASKPVDKARGRTETVTKASPVPTRSKRGAAKVVTTKAKVIPSPVPKRTRRVVKVTDSAATNAKRGTKTKR